jgi:hypothetical protein
VVIRQFIAGSIRPFRQAQAGQTGSLRPGSAKKIVIVAILARLSAFYRFIVAI